jgi:hypothetical protein
MHLNPDKYFFEIFNEPHQMVNDSFHIMFTAVIDTIRKYTTAHTIVVSPNMYSSGVGFNKYRPLADTNLIYTMHTYDPFPFTHQGFSWANPYYGPGRPYPGSGADFAIPLQWNFAMQWRDSFHLPVFLGEFGVGIYADDASRCNWIDTVARYIRTNNLPSFSWDVRWDFGLYKSGIISADSIIPCIGRALGLYGDTLNTGVKPLHNILPIQVYPNPASDVVVCCTNTADEIFMEVMDNTGRKVFEKRFTNKYNLVTRDWPAGVYLMKIASGAQTTVQKVVIER